MGTIYQVYFAGGRRRSSTLGKRKPAAEAASDRSRVIYSSPFRRLQQKAQVFSLEGNAAVRTRLTHSLEVADVGRLIARKAASLLVNKKHLEESLGPAFVDVVETACLMHDIGNPPFGHFGEAAIVDWFRRNATSALEGVSREQLSDFLEFDGNPQGFRMVTRLQRNIDRFGLNLTHAQLLCHLKYVRAPHERDAHEAAETRKGIFKKAGFFLSEEQIVKDAFDAMGWDYSARRRFPLTYIMEAADDIAYCISDIEDGVEKGIIDPRRVLDELKQRWSGVVDKARWRGLLGLLPTSPVSSQEAAERFWKLKAAYAREMIARAAQTYADLHDEMLAGQRPQLFDEKGEEQRVIDELKTVARRDLFTSPDAENMELAGYRIIYGLMEHYAKLLELSREQFQTLLDARGNPSRRYASELDMHWRLFNRLPKKYVAAYEDQREGVDDPTERFLRAHLVVDYIAGMTDMFALETYQLLSGVRVG
ncbi:MAG: dGTPase [Myxococcota bacterium]